MCANALVGLLLKCAQLEISQKSASRVMLDTACTECNAFQTSATARTVHQHPSARPQSVKSTAQSTAQSVTADCTLIQWINERALQTCAPAAGELQLLAVTKIHACHINQNSALHAIQVTRWIAHRCVLKYCAV